MGQKITEHPAVDNWVKLMREVDATGATSHHKYRRQAKDAKEWGEYQQMQLARTRTYIGVNGEPREVLHSTLCLECGSVLGDMVGATIKRQIWTQSGHTDYYVCAACSGKRGLSV